MAEQKKHRLSFERVMKTDPNHPTHLEATDRLAWECVCGDNGEALEELLEALGAEHPHKS